MSMSTNAYTEDQFVEQPAIGLFAVIGWQMISAMDETFSLFTVISTFAETIDFGEKLPYDFTKSTSFNVC